MNFVVESVLGYYRLHPVRTTVNALLALTFPVDDFLIPYFTGQIVTAVQRRRPWLRPLVALATLLVAMQVFFSLAAWHDATVLPGMQNHIRHEMTRRLVEDFDRSQREAPAIGEVVSSLVKIPLTTTCLFEQVKNYLLPYLISFVATSGYIMSHDLVLGAVVLAAVLLVFALVLTSPAGCMRTTVEQDASLSRIDGRTEDVVRNLSTVYAAHQVESELARLRDYERAYERAFVANMGCISRTRIAAVAVLAFIIVFTAATCYAKTRAGKMSAGTCVAILLIVVQWFGTLGWVVGNCRELVVDWGIVSAYERIRDAHGRPAATVRPRACAAAAEDGVLFRGVRFEVPGRREPVLRGLDLHVPRGQRAAIVGDIGSGKSTLLKLLLRLQSPSDGEVFLDGTPVSCLDVAELRGRVGLVAQHPQLFDRTVYENIVYGVADADRTRVEALVEELGLADAFAGLRGGLDAPCGKHGSSLSGGQRQLVAAMRTMLVDPEVVALDEPSNNIDARTKAKLISVLRRLLRGKTALIVTHDRDLLDLADVVYEVAGGKARLVR